MITGPDPHQLSHKKMEYFLNQHQIGKHKEQTEYLLNLEEQGFDDIDMFLTRSEQQIKEILKEFKITKLCHVLKFIEGIHHVRKPESVLSESSAPPLRRSSSELLDSVVSLLLPHLVNPQHVHFNTTVMDVYEASFRLFKDEFTKYVKGQRQMRHDLEQEVAQVEEVVFEEK